MLRIDKFPKSAILLTAWAALLTGSIGCGESLDDANAAAKQVVYVCSETKQLVLAPPQPTPAENPATGRRTLLRALYCPKCKAWQAAPASDQSSTHPLNLRCKKHDVPLTTDGPLDNVQQIPANPG